MPVIWKKMGDPCATPKWNTTINCRARKIRGILYLWASIYLNISRYFSINTMTAVWLSTDVFKDFCLENYPFRKFIPIFESNDASRRRHRIYSLGYNFDNLPAYGGKLMSPHLVTLSATYAPLSPHISRETYSDNGSGQSTRSTTCSSRWAYAGADDSQSH